MAFIAAACEAGSSAAEVIGLPNHKKTTQTAFPALNITTGSKELA
jgi:hypothetical protein